MTAALATPADLDGWPGAPPVTDPVRAGKALQKATDVLIPILGWDPRLSVRTLTVARRAGTCGHVYGWCGCGADPIWLPALNVTAVAVVDSAAVTLTPVADYDVDLTVGRVRVRRAAAGWPLTVTYTAGYTEAELAPLRGVVCDLAVELSGALPGRPVVTWTSGGESETYGSSSTPAAAIAADPRVAPFVRSWVVA